MPAPLAPPPLTDIGALNYPRTLNRWLDDNPVTPLCRTQAYITLPAFSQAVAWTGYSTLIAAFNFEGPNNFSFKALSGLPANPNYLLCVMWVQNGITHRYAFWSGVGEVVPFNVVLYTGQLIKKNFRLEIWSVDQTSKVGSTVVVTGTPGGTEDGTYTWNGSIYANGPFGYGIGQAAGIWNLGIPPFIGMDVIAFGPSNKTLFGVWTAFGGGAFSITDTVNYTATQAVTLTFYTSVLGKIDYMYSSDFILVGSDPEVTNFNCPNLNLPLAFPSNAAPTTN